MKRFAFSLQKVLEVREWKEKRAEAALAAASGRCALLEAELAANAERAAANARERFSPGRTLDDYRAAERFGARLESEKGRLLDSLAKAELAREEARKAWIEANRERELVGKLRDRKMAEYYRAASREETARLDDIGQTSRVARRRREAEEESAAETARGA
ncbi:MAG TPA: flagellar export protein FliJ [Spirochaetales bacterium]|nr:flagellar export protein FliJ [Spirochaetales bacterium]